MKVPFNKPFATGQELANIEQAIQNRHLSGDGQFTKRCHAWLETRTGAKKALLTHSCTAALELCALLSEVGPGDEVIMPSYTFVSTANAFVLRGAVPVFVDIRPDTLNLDERLVEAAITPRTRAICAVHYAGVACEMDAILELAARRGLAVFEDAAQGVLASYKGRALGSMGAAGALSFHETKNIISGEGGALLVNDDRLRDRAEILREKGTNRSAFFRGAVDKYTWVDIGSSYLPSEILAAFLAAQLEHAEDITRERLAIWQRYHDAFADAAARELVIRPTIPAECTHNAHMYYLVVRSLAERTRLLARLAERGVNAVFHYVPLHSSPAGRRFGRAAGALPVTDMAGDRLVRLPLWAGLPAETVADVAALVLETLGVKRVAIIQPNYVPWKGYFDIIHDVDCFVFLDDVQYTVRDWRNRNKIKTHDGKTTWLSVPTLGGRNQRICEVEIDRSQSWQRKHTEAVRHSYGKTPGFAEFFPRYVEVVNQELRLLSELDVALTREICAWLGLAPEFRLSSELAPSGAKDERLIDIVQKVGGDHYLSGPAARDYIQPERFAAAGIGLAYHDYAGYPEYRQIAEPFDHYVSILDLVFAVGRDAPDYIWGARRVRS